MYAINRVVIVIKPKEPFVDWVNSTEDTGVVITLDELRQDCTVCLIPEVQDDDELQEILERNYPLLFNLSEYRIYRLRHDRPFGTIPCNHSWYKKQ